MKFKSIQEGTDDLNITLNYFDIQMITRLAAITFFNKL